MQTRRKREAGLQTFINELKVIMKKTSAFGHSCVCDDVII